jgi:hypothetical protein
MTSVEVEAARTFRNGLKTAWDNRRTDEGAILRSVDGVRTQARYFFEEVQRIATEITRMDVSLHMSELVFDMETRSVLQAFLLAGQGTNHTVSLSFGEGSVTYSDTKCPTEQMDVLFESIAKDLLEVFKP